MKNFLIKILTRADTKGLQDTAQQADNVETQLDQAEDEAKNLNDTLKKAGKIAGLAILAHQIANAAKALFNAAKGAASFKMEISRAAFMAKKFSWRELHDGAIAVSNATGTARDAIGKGLYQALSKGIPEENLFETLTMAAKAAKADGDTVEHVIEGLTTNLNAFGLDIADKSRVLTAMFTAVSVGGATFGEISANIATVAPVAAAMDVPLSAILKSVAALTASGTPTAQAMTQIRAALTGVNKVLPEGWAKTMSFQQALKKVKEQAGGSQRKLKALVATDEAVNGVLGLTTEKANDVADAFDNLSKKGDPFKDAVDAVSQHDHWEKAGVLVSNFFNKVGDVADKSLKPLVDQFNELATALSSDDGLWKALDDKMESVAQSIGNIWSALEKGKGQEVADLMGETILAYLRRGGELIGEIIINAIKTLPVEIAKGVINAVTTEHIDIDVTRPWGEKIQKGNGTGGLYEQTGLTPGQQGITDNKAKWAALEAAEDYARRTEAVHEAIKTTFEDLSEETEQGAAEQAEKIKEAATEATTITNDSIAAAVAEAKANAEKLKKAAEAHENTITKTTDAEAEKLKANAEANKQLLVEAAETFNGGIGDAVANIGGGIEVLGEGVGELSTATSEGIRQTVAGVDELTTANEAAFAEIIGTMNTMLYTIQDVAQMAAQANSKVDNLRNQIA